MHSKEIAELRQLHKPVICQQQGNSPDFLSVNALMTFPNADKDKLMVLASFSRKPEAPVFLTRSEPAKSTSVSLPMITLTDTVQERVSYDRECK